MELPRLLESMAEASVTLAGFAAAFRAFASGDDPDGYSTVRLTIVIEGGLSIAFLCDVRAALSAAGLTPGIAWRTGNFVAAACILPRFPSGSGSSSLGEDGRCHGDLPSRLWQQSPVISL